MLNRVREITILDPSLRDHSGNESINLGDVIIYEAIQRTLDDIFPNAVIHRVSTHTPLLEQHYRQLTNSDLVFIGGTNILSSDIKKYNQWKISNEVAYYLSPKVKDVILWGVGWWQYQDDPTEVTGQFYREILSDKKLHSVRDSYTAKMLAKIGITNVLNTSCPTTWLLDGIDPNRNDLQCNNCVFTLTDYYPDPEADSRLIDIILSHYSGDIYFFPQGSRDEEYINSLNIFNTNKRRISVLSHSVDALDEVISHKRINYVGTRLHGGTRCLQGGLDAIILAVDNRAAEIGRDIGLPVVQRSRLEDLSRWLEGKRMFSPIRLPSEAIRRWKEQFSGTI